MRRPQIVMMAVLAIGLGLAPLTTASADRGDGAPDGTMLRKFGRGVSNLLTGWMEIPHQIHQRYDTHDPVASAAVGLVKGLTMGAARTAVGVVETVTFVLPIPPQYGVILPPPGYFHRD